MISGWTISPNEIPDNVSEWYIILYSCFLAVLQISKTDLDNIEFVELDSLAKFLRQAIPSMELDITYTDESSDELNTPIEVTGTDLKLPIALNKSAGHLPQIGWFINW